MAIDIRLPNINATTEAGQLSQIRSYLYQFAEQLKWALNAMESGTGTGMDTNVPTSSGSGSTTEDPATTFNSIKSLIIKSADIVEAYYEEINQRLEGEYVAQSDFGTYSEKTTSDIVANSKAITQNYNNVQTLAKTVDGLYDKIIDTSAYIKTGLLYYEDSGEPVYGLEIGQTNTVDGVDTFDKFARFSSDRLSFYDQNDTEVAYISDYKLFITNAEVTGALTLGKYRINTASGLAFKWVGGDS